MGLTAKEEARLEQLLAKKAVAAAEEMSVEEMQAVMEERARQQADRAGDLAEAREQYEQLNRAGRREVDAGLDADGGFVPPRKTFSINYEGELKGLWLRARSLPVGKLLDLVDLMDVVDEAGDSNDPEQLKAVRGLFEGFGEALIAWNLRDFAKDPETGELILDADGNPIRVPVPPTVDGMYSQDLPVVFQIIGGWMEAVSGVAAPLAAPSNSGGTSPEVTLPMAPPSGNPTS